MFSLGEWKLRFLSQKVYRIGKIQMNCEGANPHV